MKLTSARLSSMTPAGAGAQTIRVGVSAVTQTPSGQRTYWRANDTSPFQWKFAPPMSTLHRAQAALWRYALNAFSTLSGSFVIAVSKAFAGPVGSLRLSLIHISEPTRQAETSYA